MSTDDEKHDDEREQEAGGEREPRDDEESDSAIGSRNVFSASPLIWILLAAAIGWAIFATVTSGGTPPKNVRAIVVPTDQQERVIVALPCSAVGSGSSSPGSGGFPGGTSVVLPRDSGRRVVLLAGCRGGGSSAAGSATGDSGSSGTVAYVLAPGTPVPQPGSRSPVSLGGASDQKPKIADVFTVPETTDAETVVVVPCQSAGSDEPAQRSTPPSSGRGLLVAPPCGG